MPDDIVQEDPKDAAQIEGYAPAEDHEPVDEAKENFIAAGVSKVQAVVDAFPHREVPSYEDLVDVAETIFRHLADQR